MPLISVSVLLVELEKDGAQSARLNNTSETMVMLIIINKTMRKGFGTQSSVPTFYSNHISKLL